MSAKRNSGTILPKGKLERDADHNYTVDGNPIPGVTGVISGCRLSDFSMVKQEIIELAQLRGSYVHATTQFYDEGDLVEDSLSDVLKPYLAGWKRMRKETGFKPTRIEVMDYDPIRLFAGQVDRIGLIRRKDCILDIKPPTRQKWWPYQTAGYSIIFFPGRIPMRLCISLLPDGTYRIHEHPREEFLHDRDVFLAALLIEQEKRKAK